MTIFYNYTTYGNRTERISGVKSIIHNEEDNTLSVYKRGSIIPITIELSRLMFFDLEPKRGDKLD